MSDPRKEIWEKRKKIGRSNYLIRFGLLPWGVGLTILCSLVELITMHNMNPVWVPIRLVVFCFVGFFIANSRWQSMENRYESTMNQRP